MTDDLAIAVRRIARELVAVGEGEAPGALVEAVWTAHSFALRESAFAFWDAVERYDTLDLALGEARSLAFEWVIGDREKAVSVMLPQLNRRLSALVKAAELRLAESVT